MFFHFAFSLAKRPLADSGPMLIAAMLTGRKKVINESAKQLNRCAQWIDDGWHFHKEFNEAEKFMQITPTPESLRVSESANAFASFCTIERKEVINLNDVEVCDLPSGEIEISKREDEKFPMLEDAFRPTFPELCANILSATIVPHDCLMACPITNNREIT